MSEPVSPPAQAHLLVVDDVEDNREILARRLRRAGYAVTNADSGEAALAALARQRFDLVLLDWMMPGLSGIDVLHRLRDSGERHPPVIIVTARDAAQDVVQALEAGASDYVTKPLEFPVALARVRTQLARSQAEAALRQLNGALEQRVAERTASLLDANARLEREVEVRRQAEAALRQALVAAEAAGRAKAAFLANASHELRTPLNAIIGFSELIRDEAAGPLGTAAYRDYAADIHASGHRLLDAINNLLALSRAEARTLALREGTVDPAMLVKACAETVRKPAAARGIALSCEAGDGLPGLRGDESALRQALAALLDNAVKFGRAGGRIAVEARRSADGGLALRVADTGTGMSQAEVQSALQPFMQLDQSLTRRHEGLGLGLPVAGLIAEAHDGRLEIASTPGVGTAVALVLPRHRLVEADGAAIDSAA